MRVSPQEAARNFRINGGTVVCWLAADYIDAALVEGAGIIAEQNLLIAAAYTALLEARDHGRADLPKVEATIAAIEHWHQQRQPTNPVTAAIAARRAPTMAEISEVRLANQPKEEAS